NDVSGANANGEGDFVTLGMRSAESKSLREASQSDPFATIAGEMRAHAEAKVEAAKGGKEASLQIVTTDELTNGTLGRLVRDNELNVRDRAIEHARVSGILGAAAFDGRNRPGWGPMVLQHFTYSTDRAFDDLTAFVPALVADGFDLWRAGLA